MLSLSSSIILDTIQRSLVIFSRSCKSWYNICRKWLYQSGENLGYLCEKNEIDKTTKSMLGIGFTPDGSPIAGIPITYLMMVRHVMLCQY